MVPEREQAFVAEMRERFAIEALGAGSAEAAVRGADIVITAGPIEERRKPVIVPAWLKPGSLVVTLDYDSYITDEAVAAMDLVLTDDHGQIEDARLHEGKFTGVHRIDAELGELIASGRAPASARTSASSFSISASLWKTSRPASRSCGAPSEKAWERSCPYNRSFGAARPRRSSRARATASFATGKASRDRRARSPRPGSDAWGEARRAASPPSAP